MVDPGSISFEIEDIIEVEDDDEMIAERQIWTADITEDETQDPFESQSQTTGHTVSQTSASLRKEANTLSNASPSSEETNSSDRAASSQIEPPSTSKTSKPIYQRVWEAKRGTKPSSGLNPNVCIPVFIPDG